MKRLLPLGSSLVLGLLFWLAFGFPNAWGGLLSALGGFLFPVLLLEMRFRGRALGWIFLACLLGVAAIFAFVPRTVAVKGDLPWSLAWTGAVLFWAWEALGFMLVAAAAGWAFRRRGPWAAALTAALGILLWEAYGFHVYPWSWGTAVAGLPFLARGAAFLTTRGFSALLWGAAAWTAAALVEGRPGRIFLGPLAAFGLLAAFGAAWPLLPREPERRLDLVMIQPDFPAGERFAGMERQMWALTDPVLQANHLPRPDAPTLVLWPESSVLGRDDRWPDPRLSQEAAGRGIAWLYGTEGGLYNLVRGEAPGQRTFLQAKVEPMAFGERMPGPAWLRHWLDRKLGFLSQEPGTLTPGGFAVPAPGEPLHVAPLICSEALDPERARVGLEAAHGELLANLTNDGWFEATDATDLHGAHIRLRACELGVPLARATLTGKSGLFLADGTGGLWGEPMSQATYALRLAWRPVSTPARSPWVLRLLLLGTAAAALLSLFRKRP
ncbi:MAG TPA: nitrilase-related carbon-nitrogen hydrolase [Holophagaceae bacterium]|nr:nitrilase-related carbon-nitrogen hydrolase [Holophagaceae bacterium]